MAGLFSPEQETDQVTDQALASLTLDSSPCLRNRLTSQNAVPESGQQLPTPDTLHSSCTSSGDQSDKLDSVMFHPLPVVPVIHDIHRPLLLLNHVSHVPELPCRAFR